MFEINITNNKNSKFSIKSKTRYGYNSENHVEFLFEDDFIKINGLRYKKSTNCLVDTPDILVIVIGYVYQRFTFKNRITPLSAKEILEDILLNEDNALSNFKGNYLLIIYDKKATTIKIIKDQLGMKYLYYNYDNKYFYVTTNLSDFKELETNYNYSAIIEKIIFTYPLDRESFIENVFILNNGEILALSKNSCRVKKYFILESLCHNQEYLEKFNIKRFINMFEASVLQRASCSEKSNVSFTGGFDGRCNVAILLKHGIEFQAYSFGKLKGENTEVPSFVSSSLKINYKPIYLEEQYEKDYYNCAIDAIYYSDGFSIFERANYIYAMKQLFDYSHCNITGLMGGEIVGMLNQIVDFINRTYYLTIYKNKIDVSRLLERIPILKYLNKELIYDANINSRIKENITRRIEYKKEFSSKYHRNGIYYLIDLMSLGFQRFFGIQMHLERYFSENLTSFYDLDLITYLFSTDFIEKYENSYKTSVWYRRNNRKIQTLIINDIYPDLAEFPVDRGYPPRFLLDIRKILIPFYYYKRRLLNKNRPPEFTSDTWCKILYETINISGFENLINKNAIEEFITTYTRQKYNKEFNHLLSILIWLNMQNNIIKK